MLAWRSRHTMPDRERSSGTMESRLMRRLRPTSSACCGGTSGRAARMADNSRRRTSREIGDGYKVGQTIGFLSSVPHDGLYRSSVPRRPDAGNDFRRGSHEWLRYTSYPPLPLFVRGRVGPGSLTSLISSVVRV